MFEIITTLLGGLALFIYAITSLSATLREAFTDKARRMVGSYTRNLVLSVIVGTVVTIALGSSSAVIIIAIIFVNAHALTFKQALGIVMGANIGTTFSSQLISLDIAQYSLVPLIIGLVMQFTVRGEQGKIWAKAIFFFGMLFFGLYIMESSVEPLKDSDRFMNWLARLDNPVRGALIGGLVTLIIQSSSATVGIAITLGKQGLIDLSGGLAVMLGAELGTCSDTLIATIGGTRAGIKTGLFHLFFNLTTIGIGLLIFPWFVDAVEYLSGKASLNRMIANGHLLFNFSGVLLFLPFVGIIERYMNKLIPEKKLQHEDLD